MAYTLTKHIERSLYWRDYTSIDHIEPDTGTKWVSPQGRSIVTTPALVRQAHHERIPAENRKIPGMGAMLAGTSGRTYTTTTRRHLRPGSS